MENDKEVEALLRWMVFPILVLVFAFQAYACRALYADGASFFVGLLTAHDFPWWDKQRIFNHLLTKGPALLAMGLGIRSIVVLRYIYSSWMLFCPLLVWGGALWNLRRDILYWPFVMLFCFVYYNTDFFAISVYNLCFALVAYCFAGLLRPLPYGKFERAVLLIAGALLPLQYPATLFLGPLLCFLVAVKPEGEWNGASRFYRWALFAFFILSAASGLWETIAPRDPSNFASARNTLSVLRDAQFWCVLFYVLTAMSLFCTQQGWLRLELVAVCVCLLARLAHEPFRDFPSLHYGVRAYVSLVFAASCAGLWWFRTRGVRATDANGVEVKTFLVAALGFVLFVTLSSFDMKMSLDYGRYLEAFRAEVNAKSGIVPYGESSLPRVANNNRFMWGWTFPVLSITLRDNAQKAIILNPSGNKGWQPFDPYVQVPDLDMYYR